MQEIIINIDQKNGEIGFNFEELKEILALKLEDYKNVIFTEETKSEAKKTVAELRKLKKAISDRRIEVKKSFMQPYTDFETRVKELDALIDEPIAYISTQVEEFDRKRLEERKGLIRQIYQDSIAGMEEYLPLQRIYNSKWENTATSKKAIKEEIAGRVEAVRRDLETISSMDSQYEDKGMEAYKQTLSLADAIQRMNSYEKQEEEIRKRQEENREIQEKIRKQQDDFGLKEPVLESSTEILPVPKQATVIEVDKLNVPKKNVPIPGTALYEVEADRFQIVQVETALKELNIAYRRIR